MSGGPKVLTCGDIFFNLLNSLAAALRAFSGSSAALENIWKRFVSIFLKYQECLLQISSHLNLFSSSCISSPSSSTSVQRGERGTRAFFSTFSSPNVSSFALLSPRFGWCSSCLSKRGNVFSNLIIDFVQWTPMCNGLKHLLRNLPHLYLYKKSNLSLRERELRISNFSS